MFKRYLWAVAPAILFLLVAGCGNPIKRAPANAFPGTDDYDKRVASFKISPAEAYQIAHEEAMTTQRLQFLSKRPTVVVKRWYVFSLPKQSGANLQGFHVHGDTGEVKFVNDKKVIPHNKR